MVRWGGVVADIGTDHAYLPCALVLEGRSPRVYASDINRRPLSRAEKTIELYGLSDKVEAILSDGLSALKGRGITDVVIAGMGGELISSILCQEDWAKTPELSFVLQPMTRHEHLRSALYGMGYQLEEERAVTDGDRIYTVMRAVYTGKMRKIPLLLAWTGKIWDNNDNDSIKYLAVVNRRLGKIIKGLEHKRSEQLEPHRALYRKIKERVDRHVQGI